jgi:hypothetical protein
MRDYLRMHIRNQLEPMQLYHIYREIANYEIWPSPPIRNSPGAAVGVGGYRRACGEFSPKIRVSNYLTWPDEGTTMRHDAA